MSTVSKNPYASGTEVSEEKSEMEIKAVARRYGADAFVSMYDGNTAQIGFRCKNRFVRFRLEMPAPTETRFWTAMANATTPRKLTAPEADKRYQQERRRLWRALALLIKSKLEAVESGIETFDNAFLAHFVLPNGTIVGDHIKGELERAYTGNWTPPMLGSGE